jgi:hypothetical protein
VLSVGKRWQAFSICGTLHQRPVQVSSGFLQLSRRHGAGTNMRGDSWAMTGKPVVVWSGTLLSRALLAVALVAGTPASAQEVIVNPDVADRSISRRAVRAIFSMRLRQWPDGKPVRVFVLPDRNPVHVSFAKNRLNTFPHQLRRSWDLLVYSGSGQAPTVVETPAEMLQKVSSTTGAIGYLPEGQLTEGGKDEQVHILEIR